MKPHDLIMSFIRDIGMLTSLREYRSSYQRCSVKKGVLRNFAKFTEKHLCQRLFFNKKETLAQVFSCEFREISKNTFFTEHLWTNASENNVVWNFRLPAF